MRTQSPLAPFERLLEPAARAARRGDAEQIRAVLSKVRSAQRTFLRDNPSESLIETARGMVFALEGILGIVLGCSAADRRYETLRRFPYALHIMAIIAQKARQVLLSGSAGAKAIREKELAEAAGLELSRIRPLIEALLTCGIITARIEKTETYFEITAEGAHLLEAGYPGWQILRIKSPPAALHVV